MRDFKTLLLPVFLGLVALMAIYGATYVRKESSMLWVASAKSAAKAAEDVLKAKGVLAPTVSDSDRITARQLIDGLTRYHGLKADVKLQPDGSIVVSPSTDAGETLASSQSVLGFLSSLAAMPYQLDLKAFCVGPDCPRGMEVAVVLLGR